MFIAYSLRFRDCNKFYHHPHFGVVIFVIEPYFRYQLPIAGGHLPKFLLTNSHFTLRYVKSNLLYFIPEFDNKFYLSIIFHPKYKCNSVVYVDICLLKWKVLTTAEHISTLLSNQ